MNVAGQIRLPEVDFLTMTHIEEARSLAQASNRRVVEVLEESLGVPPAEFTIALAQALQFRWLTNQRMHALSPAFDVLPFSEASVHECVLLRSEKDGLLLVIGDPALKIDRSRYVTYDLAEEWIRFTGKPFVFAFWAVRDDALQQTKLDLPSTFNQSRDHGLQQENLDAVVHDWAPKLGITEQFARDYLTHSIHFYLDEECLDGLRLFYAYAHRYGVLPKIPELRFVGSPQPVPQADIASKSTNGL